MMERFSPDTVERLSGALGAAVLKVWGQLPHDFQHKIFEEAVISSGEAIRSNLAQLLHREASAHIRGDFGPGDPGAGQLADGPD